jgi:hypothetical protein
MLLRSSFVGTSRNRAGACQWRQLEGAALQIQAEGAEPARDRSMGQLGRLLLIITKRVSSSESSMVTVSVLDSAEVPVRACLAPCRAARRGRRGCAQSSP